MTDLTTRVWTATLFLIALLPPAALPQGTGTIHGNVKDQSGAAIVNARVTALLTGRGVSRTVTTNERGEYVLPLLPVGAFSILVESTGFSSFRQEQIELTANENVRIDAQLKVGDVAESVAVTAEAPQVDSRSSVIGTLIDSRRLLEIPTNGRNVMALAILLPGVSQATAPQTFTDDRGGSIVSINGARPNQNAFLFDGGSFNALFRNSGLNYPPPDALQEVKVLTNSFGAEYGRNSGAVFNVVTRSGTNELHGSGWEFFRNHNLNARNFFAPSAKPKLIQNQYGGTLGGPIRKNKLFLFGSYEALRIRPASLVTAAFPFTAAERTGDFSAAPGTIRDPLTNQPFPDKRIPASRIDRVASQINSQMIPLPNRADGQYVTTFPSPQDNNNVMVRADYSAGKHTLEGRYYWNRASSLTYTGNIPSYMPIDQGGTTQSANIGDTWVLRPNLLLQSRLTFSRYYNDTVTLNRIALSDFGGNFPVIGKKQPPSITVTGRVALGNASSGDSVDVNQTWDFNQSVNWNRGNHAVKAGWQWLQNRYLNRTNFQSMGVFTMTSQITGNAAADYMLGRAATLSVASPELEQSGVQANFVPFIQDDWRIHPRLTLNLGLRYELGLPWMQPHDLWSTFRPGQQSKLIPTAPIGIVFPGDPGIPRGQIQTDKNNFAPRFGFAWDVAGNGRTSLRGAYGIFFDGANADMIQNMGQPFRYTFNFNSPASLTDPLLGQPTIPLAINLSNPTFTGAQTVAYPNPAFRTGYVQAFNLNVQRQVFKDLVIQVGYVGRLGRKLILGYSTNPAIYGPGATLANTDARRIYAGFGELRAISSEANSGYNALQMEFTKRFSRGFSVQGAYTFSRSIDMRSAVAAVSLQTPNVFNLKSEIGLSDFHAKHIANMSWIWDLPAPAAGGAVVRAIAGGWQLNGLFNLRTGLPVNILGGTDAALSATVNQRPDATGDPILSSDRSRGEKVLAWFNRGAFTQPAPGRFGNTGRNALIGPGQAVMNMGLFRNFKLPGREGLRLQFRSEFFNVTNHTNLGAPNATLSAGANMGRITSAGGARVVQLAMKVSF